MSIRDALEAARARLSPQAIMCNDEALVEQIDAALRELDADQAEPVATLRVERAKNGRLRNWLDGAWQQNLPVGEYHLYSQPTIDALQARIRALESYIAGRGRVVD